MEYMACNGSMTGPVCLTPRSAAELFFQRYPLKRRCSIGEGYMQAGLFITPMRARRWLDITRRTLDILPDVYMPPLPLEVTHAGR